MLLDKRTATTPIIASGTASAAASSGKRHLLGAVAGGACTGDHAIDVFEPDGSLRSCELPATTMISAYPSEIGF